MDNLVQDSLASHGQLEERLARAKAARPSRDPARPREEYPAIDSYLAAASRHVGAMLTVVLPLARSRLSNGPARCHDYVAAVRRHEESLNAAKAKLYHSAYATRDSWTRIWNEVDASFDRMWNLESQIINDLAESRRPKDPEWVQSLHKAELRSPTRPHPHIPHSGVPGRAARFVAKRVDAFWDAAEGRMVPAPVHARNHQKDGLFTQYLMADPHLAQPDGPWAAEPRRASEAGPRGAQGRGTQGEGTQGRPSRPQYGDPQDRASQGGAGSSGDASPLGNPSVTPDEVVADPLGNPVGTPLATSGDTPSTAGPTQGPSRAPHEEDPDERR